MATTDTRDDKVVQYLRHERHISTAGARKELERLKQSDPSQVEELRHRAGEWQRPPVVPRGVVQHDEPVVTYTEDAITEDEDPDTA